MHGQRLGVGRDGLAQSSCQRGRAPRAGLRVLPAGSQPCDSTTPGARHSRPPCTVGGCRAARRLQHRLARQHHQVVFQAAKVELRALLQPLGIGGALALVFFGLEAVCRYSTSSTIAPATSSSSPSSHSSATAVAAAVVAAGLLQQRKVRRWARRQEVKLLQ